MARATSAAERLLDAGQAAFARTGFEGASTHAIAKAAGVPQGLVRHHFGSKEGLWSAVVKRGLASVQSDVERLASGLTVSAWTAIVERHAALAAVLVHALLEGGPRAERAASLAEPVWRQLRALQRAAQPLADDTLLPMWLMACLAVPLLRRASGDGAPWLLRSRETERLLSWLCGESAPRAPGLFAVHAARSRLRGTS